MPILVQECGVHLIKYDQGVYSFGISLDVLEVRNFQDLEALKMSVGMEKSGK